MIDGWTRKYPGLRRWGEVDYGVVFCGERRPTLDEDYPDGVGGPGRCRRSLGSRPRGVAVWGESPWRMYGRSQHSRRAVPAEVAS